MIWDWFVQLTGKYCSIRRIEYSEFETGIFGRMESAPGLSVTQNDSEPFCQDKGEEKLENSLKKPKKIYYYPKVF